MEGDHNRQQRARGASKRKKQQPREPRQPRKQLAAYNLIPFCSHHRKACRGCWASAAHACVPSSRVHCANHGVHGTSRDRADGSQTAAVTRYGTIERSPRTLRGRIHRKTLHDFAHAAIARSYLTFRMLCDPPPPWRCNAMPKPCPPPHIIVAEEQDNKTPNCRISPTTPIYMCSTESVNSMGARKAVSMLAAQNLTGATLDLTGALAPVSFTGDFGTIFLSPTHTTQ